MRSVLVITLALVVKVHSLPCETGQRQLDDNFCLISPVEGETLPMTFEDARQFCADQEAFLFEPRTDYYQSTLMNLGYGDQDGVGFWVGLDNTGPGQYQWLSDGSELNFTAWSSSMPSATEDLCIAVTPDHAYFWDEHDCSGEMFLPVCLKETTFNPCQPSDTARWDYYLPGNTCVRTGASTENIGVSRAFCSDQGSHLVEILDEDKSVYVREVIGYYGLPGGTGAWIGLGDSETEGVYVWETSGIAATYFDWGYDPPQPDSGTDGQCVVVYNAGYHWYDTACSETFAFSPICEKDAPPPEEQEKLRAIWLSRNKWE